MNHWATDLIGLPYTDGANGEALDGPNSYNCWGLVRCVFRREKGIELPLVHVDPIEPDFIANKKAMKAVFERSGWRPVREKAPQEFDICLMSNVHGRHVGVATYANMAMQLLHSIEGEGVSVIAFRDLWMLGFNNITIWRRKP
jgi:hypothetical protein